MIRRIIFAMHIGILYICTGSYTVFWKEFYESCERYLLPHDEKFYFVFTDASSVSYEAENKRIKRIHQEDLGWPDNTLKRFHIFLKNVDLYGEMDYLYFFNANLRLQKIISREEFIPQGDKLLVTVHPGYFNKSNTAFPYERNANSTAYIPMGKGECYIQGALNGGKTNIYIQMMQELKRNIDKDEKACFVASWHDESHLNAYIFHHKNFQALSPSYLYPEDWDIPFPPYILIRDKKKYMGHEFLREKESVLDFCRKYKSIYIYGSGIKGRNTFVELQDNGIIPMGFIVSDDRKKNGKDVLWLSEFSENPSLTGVVIAAKPEYQGTIKLLLKSRGYRNIHMVF